MGYLLLTTRSTNGWSVEILKWLDWSLGSKVGTQSILVFCLLEIWADTEHYVR